MGGFGVGFGDIALVKDCPRESGNRAPTDDRSKHTDFYRFRASLECRNRKYADHRGLFETLHHALIVPHGWPAHTERAILAIAANA